MTRHVFGSTREVYHQWAAYVTDIINGPSAREGSDGRNGSHSASFSGFFAYSYRAPIARLTMSARGQWAVMLTTERFSVTTSRHQSQLRQAVRHLPCFDVLDIDDDGVRAVNVNLASYRERIDVLAGRATRARSATVRTMCKLDQVALMREANQYAQFYSEPRVYDAIDALAAVSAAEDAENERTWAERQAAAREANRAKLAERAEQWKAGANAYIEGHPDTFLRVVRAHGDCDGMLQVETSRGAHVPLAAAERLYRAMQRQEAVEGGRVGSYTVRELAHDGIHIGCHFITWSEVERFAQSQGWTTGAVAPVERTRERRRHRAPAAARGAGLWQ
jgi:hypothetical protein